MHPSRDRRREMFDRSDEHALPLPRSLAIVHLDLFPEWDEGNQCLRAAFQLFMTNNEKALGDLNACIDSESVSDRFTANMYLALYADARFKTGLSKSYGKAAFRLIPDSDDEAGRPWSTIVVMAHAILRDVNKKTDCPCVDDHFFTDDFGNDCKSHKGWDCTSYAKWPTSEYMKVDENEVIDKCPKACGLCAADPPCEFLAAKKAGKEAAKERKKAKKEKKKKRKEAAKEAKTDDL